MAYIHTIEPEAATGRLAEIYRTILSSRGHLSNIWKVASLDENLIQTHVDMNIATMHSRNGITRMEREAIAVAVAAANECPY